MKLINPLLRFFLVIPILILSLGCDLVTGQQDYVIINDPDDGGGSGLDETPQQLNKNLDYIFDTNTVAKITISISSNEWNKQLFYIDTNDRHETLVHADFIYEKNGVTEVVSNIGFRIRGNTSRERPEGWKWTLHDPVNPVWRHAHFKLDFNAFEPGQRYRGLRGMILKWHKADPAYCREIYGYDLMRRFGVWTAPRAWYVQLEIDIKEDNSPADFGVYILIENFDESMLKSNFTNYSDTSQQWEGNLWKNLWGANTTSGSIYNMGIEDICLTNDSLSYRPHYDFKKYNDDVYSNRYLAFTNEAKAQFTAFLNDLNSKSGSTLKTWLEDNFDVELFLRAIAVEVVVGKWDSLWGLNGNNWYLYFTPAGKAHYIPYDMDNSLGISFRIDYGGQNIGTASALDFKHQDYYIPLVEKILDIPEYFSMYTNYLYQLLDPANDYFSITASTNRIKTWHNLIDSYVNNDLGEFTTIEDSSDSWTDTDYYYFFSGTADGDPYSSPGANFFLTRTKSISDELGFNFDTSGGSQTTNTNTGGGETNATGYTSPEYTADSVIFKYINASADTILVRGTFNGWEADSPRLELTNVTSNMYALEVSKSIVSNGDLYKFYNVTSNLWFHDPANTNQSPDGFDSYDSIIVYSTTTNTNTGGGTASISMKIEGLPYHQDQGYFMAFSETPEIKIILTADNTQPTNLVVSSPSSASAAQPGQTNIIPLQLIAETNLFESKGHILSVSVRDTNGNTLTTNVDIKQFRTNNYKSPEIIGSNIIFRYDNGTHPSGNLLLRGEYNSWNVNSSYIMTNVSSTLYAVEVALSVFTSGQSYKFNDIGSTNWYNDPANTNNQNYGNSNSILIY